MMTRLKAALAILPGVFLTLPVLAQTSAERTGPWHYGWDWGWGHMIFGSLMMILFWGGLIVMIVFVVRWLGGGSSGAPGRQPPGNRALDILQERFARGEIDKKEFEERKGMLSN